MRALQVSTGWVVEKRVPFSDAISIVTSYCRRRESEQKEGQAQEKEEEQAKPKEIRWWR